MQTKLDKTKVILNGHLPLQGGGREVSRIACIFIAIFLGPLADYPRLAK